MTKKYEDLHELDDYQLKHSEQDVRGHTLYTNDGTKLGSIRRMLVDPDRDHVAALVLDDHRIVPVSEIEVRDGDAYIDPVGADGFNAAPVRDHKVARSPVAVNRRTRT